MGEASDIRSDGAKRWQTQQKNGNNHRNDSNMCKTKAVLSEPWAELSQAQCTERWRRNKEELGGFKLDEAKIRAKARESQDKDKTDTTTTNKQDPQDTPAGRRMRCFASAPARVNCLHTNRSGGGLRTFWGKPLYCKVYSFPIDNGHSIMPSSYPFTIGN